MKSNWRYFLGLMVVCLLAGCDNAKPSAGSEGMVLEGRTMGTFWRVSLAGVAPERREALQNAIQQQLDQDDRELSTWKSDSVLSRFNQYRGSAPQPVSHDMADIVTLSLRIGQQTAGAMDITIGPLVNLWGFGPDKQPVKTPTQQEIDAARAQTGLAHLQVINAAGQSWLKKDLPELYVDLSTVGEGFATDHLARLMEQEGVNQYLVSVGGAVLTRGKNAQGNAWQVAIQKPTDQENAVQAIVDLQGHGISTSGSYRNYYELDGKRISHVIDPATGRPIQHRLVSATVIATTALEADGWDTGLMVLGTEKAKALALREKLAVYLIFKQGDHFTSWMSPQFAAFIQPSPAH
ncbi:FAD:protein FMN transferase ApbE [Erwinia persicina]|uniref:FAD:protein FMN transferase n=1 Tax=Erwinia persicina TaxID=55211 RepID=A0A4U3F244_9GAMM|nr:FAD:protein FMN transferase ApbE [Erwinia persicina]MBD8105693.1 FAD:protein FMN transferase ApbE [Erwinia persicina]MBD8209541.1 FAD:protein FMN transferase ApbE [Erwinia persicina]MCQ4093376.1 FAD:protein FMN transferase ApbE [Erwinia persicina]MCQ4099144.1 FAD:protein FMN transferase ApbE [Erwinia persicina]TKJ86562.1 FAD:protein FMN transferase ApbE [Erwinia persicina]